MPTPEDGNQRIRIVGPKASYSPQRNSEFFTRNALRPMAGCTFFRDTYEYIGCRVTAADRAHKGLGNALD